jgi:hypothetical protein
MEEKYEEKDWGIMSRGIGKKEEVVKVKRYR